MDGHLGTLLHFQVCVLVFDGLFVACSICVLRSQVLSLFVSFPCW